MATITELRASVKDTRDYIQVLRTELGLEPVVFGDLPRSVKGLIAMDKELKAEADKLEDMEPVAKATTAPAPRTTAEVLANAQRPVGATATAKVTATHKKVPYSMEQADKFTIRAIERLRKGDYKGIHSVFSGYNQAFRDYFIQGDPITHVNDMGERGLLDLRPVKGGCMLYKSGEGPERKDKDTSALIAQILAD